jgi:hypothetical protein
MFTLRLTQCVPPLTCSCALLVAHTCARLQMTRTYVCKMMLPMAAAVCHESLSVALEGEDGASGVHDFCDGSAADAMPVACVRRSAAEFEIAMGRALARPSRCCIAIVLRQSATAQNAADCCRQLPQACCFTCSDKTHRDIKPSVRTGCVERHGPPAR